MTGWEFFTWANVAVLGLGSVVVFILFLRDVPGLISRRRRGRDTDGC